MLKKSKTKIKSCFVNVWNVIKDETRSFCETSSVHGLKHFIKDGAHSSERIFWLIIIIISAYTACVLGLVQVNRYAYNPTVVSIRKNFRDWKTKFPAVTICSQQTVDLELANAYIKRMWNVTDDQEKYQYYLDFVQLATSISFRMNVRDFWKFETDPAFDNLDLMSVVAAVASQIKVKTQIHDQNYAPIWETVITEMGVCNTFNSIFSSYQSVESWKIRTYNKTDPFRDIHQRELLECSYISKNCFVKFQVINSTAKYYVHSPYEIVEITSNPTDTIESDVEMNAVFRTSFIQSNPDVRGLNVRQRKCKYPDEHISSTITAYSNALCQMECRNRMALGFCGCRPYFYIIGDGKPCDTKGMSCIGRNMELLINLPDNLAKCSCSPQCTEMNYIPHTIKMSVINTSLSNSDNMGSVKYSLQMPKVMMYKDIIFTFNDLLASFGGFTVLFFGMSFLSIVEIFICVLRLMFKTSRSCGNCVTGNKNP